MKSFCCGKGFLVFSVTFAVGTCFALIGYQDAPPIEVKKETVLQTLPQNKLNEVPKSKCEAQDSEIYRLFKERLDIETQILRFGNRPEKKEELKVSEKRLKELNEQIAKLEKLIEEGKIKPMESSRYQDLLYIENCSKY